MIFSTSYFKPQYFNAAFLGKQEESARSGYWRLFYYNLQEEELHKRNEQEQRKTAPQRTSPRKKKAPRRITATPPKPRVIEVGAEQNQPHKLKPLFAVQPPTTLQVNDPLSLQLYFIVKELRFTLQPDYGTIAKQAAASNDEDMALVLLLLAA